MASSRTVNVLRKLSVAASSSNRVAWTCTSCRQAAQAQLQHDRSRAYSRIQPISSTAIKYKKSSASSKSSKKSPKIETPDVDEHIPNNKATANKDAEVDPYDYSQLEEGIASAVARLKDDLSRTKDAGRITPDMMESFDVELNIKNPKEKSSTAHHQKAKLGDIASVVPKGGRMLQIFAAEEAHMKALTSAIAAAGHSLTPEVDKNNPLLILVPVPPATAGTRAQAAAEAKKCFDKASLDVRNARGDAQKRFRKMELDKLVIKDELRKAHKGMEDVAKKGQDEVKKVYESALKALQQ